MNENKVKSFLFRILCGYFIGISVIAPGVSGSVMAVMMGIYRDVINIISNPFKNFKKNIVYVLPMGIGGLLSLVMFIKLFAFLFENYPAQIGLLFIGLIAGSVVEVYHQARRVSFKPHYVAGIIIAFLIALSVEVPGLSGNTANVGREFSPWYLCLAGGAAGISSIIPGMSVSFILMLFGVYEFLLKAASEFANGIFNFAYVAVPIGVCFAVGMVLFSRLVKLVFERYPGFAYNMVLGFMCGTLVVIVPGNVPGTFGDWAFCGLMLAVGLAVSVLFQWLGKILNG